MSFYTALTGLNAAQSQLEITSNNIANVNTSGFKRSRADFGDIFATSPLQKASAVIGQGVALKGVSQEFSQGNIQSSANALDLAISGDGFFMLKSADGLQSIYTRNGSFTLNDQYNVVNSAGQALQAASVDSSGKADLSNLDRLTIPKQTAGDAKQTSLISLGLNFPSDAKVITQDFNRNNPATYNKTTALTVYDQGGNSYLATVYYAKTQNASQADPTNKWQTYVFVGDTQVGAALLQATNGNGEKLYVNKYGQLKPESEVADQLVNQKTQMFELGQLKDVRTSVPAEVTTKQVTDFDLTTQAGVDFTNNALASASPTGLTAAQYAALQDAFTINIDSSSAPASIDLSSLADLSAAEKAAGGDGKLTGAQIAQAMTNVIRTKFGDDRYFDFSTASNSKFTISDGTTATDVDIAGGLTLPATTKAATVDQVVASINSQLSTANITVAYDRVTQRFKFTGPAGSSLTIRGGSTATAAGNDLLGLLASTTPIASDGTYTTSTGGSVVENGAPIRALANQRYGMTVAWDNVNQKFTFSSGSTGDNSTIQITNVSDIATSLLGISQDPAADKVLASPDAVRGIVSSPAVSTGSAIAINVANNFSVDDTNNRFVVTVDDVKSTITIPTNSSYTLDGFIAALQDRINQMTNTSGSSVCGVKVEYDKASNAFKFTTGTTGSDSFIQVSGSSTWGLANVSAGRGTTSTWTKPTQYTETVNGLPVAKYIDARGQETSSADGYSTLPEWSPIYLHKGELTFDTAGALQSPKTGTQLDTVYLPDGKGALTINIDYSKSTQYSSPFAVLSQSQDGAPEGDLIGVNISDNGLVNASYSNGTQKSLAKIALVNFSNPNGLRQIGDSSYYSSSASGTPKLGEAGAAGFGTVRAGATERANVDLTQELVDLITGQRNFQAAAKAIETSTTLTQSIINMRS